MARSPIREADAKQMFYRWGHKAGDYVLGRKCVSVGPDSDWDKILDENKWLLDERLVVKPEGLKRRGQHGLVHLDKEREEAKEIIRELASEPVAIDETSGSLTHFIIEPYIEHKPEEEHHVAFTPEREGDVVRFCEQGGIDIGDVESKARKLFVPVGTYPTADEIMRRLLQRNITQPKREILGQFIEDLFKFYADCHFAYLEINPIVVIDHTVHLLDMAAKLDSAAHFTPSARKWWGNIEFPAPFGTKLTSEELYIRELDKGGASLKLTVINPEGLIWLIPAGGAASVIYTDTIVKRGYLNKLGNYGEYSGGPNRWQTYQYFRTILDLATRGEPRPNGKAILVVGANANFTDVLETFTGACQAIEEFADKLREHRAAFFVRRAGPNDEAGLAMINQKLKELGIPAFVYGLETHLTAVVPMACQYIEEAKR